MISERANDGIKRSREQWFKRYNSKEPEKGGARKSMATRPKDWLEQTRKDWADHANQALERAGSRERITGASLEQQYRDALEAGDEREAARLEYREPGVHIGPHNVARAERGWCWRGPRPRGRWRTAIRSLRATAQRSKRWRGCCGAPTLSLPRSPSSSPPMFGIASSVVAGATALITGGADNGKCTGPSKGRRGEVHGDG